MKKHTLFLTLFYAMFSSAQPAFLDTEEVVNGFSSPVGLTNADDGSNRIFVIQQGGQIKVVENNILLPNAFLDISTLITSGGESGLLGLAFHPDYSSNGFFFINYTDTNGDTVVARYTVSDNDSNIADPNSAVIVLTFDQPFPYHNGGDLHFGPNDGFLYISTGDGSGDPMVSQDTDSLLGKILRIDVDGDDFPADTEKNYAIPVDNPFVGTSGADEVWLLGLRNPWRFSFDRLNGDLYIGDVGEGTWEEFNYLPASNLGGLNFGWPCFEGLDYSGLPGCDSNGPNEPPFAMLEHNQVNSNYCSAVGGYRYRGNDYPGLYGWYIFTDWCDGSYFAARPQGNSWEIHDMGTLIGGFAVTSMGEDEQGELYAVAWSSLFKIKGPTEAPNDLIFVDDFEP